MTEGFQYPTISTVFERSMSRSLHQPRVKRFMSFEPIPLLKEWWGSRAKISALIGGNRSLKTTNGIVKAIMIFTGMIPPALRGLYPWMLPTNRERHVRIIIHNYTKHLTETIMPFLISDDFGFLPEVWSTGWKDTDHIFTGPDGSTLSLLAVDPQKDIDPRVVRGPHVDHTLIDEITRQKIYEECVVRGATRADSPNTVDLAYCPEEGLDWTYHEIYRKGYDQSEEKLAISKRDPNYNIQRVTMFDNPHMPAVERDRIIAATPKGARPYKVYGRYTDAGADPYFNGDMLQRWKLTFPWDTGTQMVIADRIVSVEEGLFTGRLEPVPGPQDLTGAFNTWNVWEPPQDKEYYLVGVDSAEGHGAGNFSVADVWRCSENGKIDPMKARQVAQFRSRALPAGEVAEETLCMASIYGQCLYVFEVNASNGGTVRDRARFYPNVYHRIRQGVGGTIDCALIGWWTDTYNKPSALDAVRGLMLKWEQRQHRAIYSEVTMEEMRKFQEKVIPTKNRGIFRTQYRATQGYFDDTITVLWMIAYVLTVQPYALTPYRVPPPVPEKQPGVGWWEKKAQERLKQQRSAARFLRHAPTMLQLYRMNGIKKGGSYDYYRGREEGRVSRLVGQ